MTVPLVVNNATERRKTTSPSPAVAAPSVAHAARRYNTQWVWADISRQRSAG